VRICARPGRCQGECGAFEADRGCAGAGGPRLRRRIANRSACSGALRAPCDCATG